MTGLRTHLLAGRMRELDMEDLLSEPTDQTTPVVKTNKTQTPKLGLSLLQQGRIWLRSPSTGEMRGASQGLGLVLDDGEGMKESEQFWDWMLSRSRVIL